MKRFLHFLVLCLLWTSHATAQTAVVKRNVNLRSDASSDSDIVELLKPGAQLLLVEPDQINRFYHVTTDDGEDGWVWARNIKVLAGTAPPTPHPNPPGPTTPPPNTSGDLFSRLMNANKIAIAVGLVVLPVGPQTSLPFSISGCPIAVLFAIYFHGS